MDELRAIEKLAEAARKEQPPVGPVGTAVMARITAARRARLRTLSLFAAASAVAASLVLIFGLLLGNGSADPLTQLCLSFEVTTLW